MATFESKAKNIRDKGYSNSMDGSTGVRIPTNVRDNGYPNSADGLGQTAHYVSKTGDLKDRGYPNSTVASNTGDPTNIRNRGYSNSMDGMYDIAHYESKAKNIRDKGYSNSMDGYEEPEIIYFTPGKNSMDEKTINTTNPNPYKTDGNLTERGYVSSTEGMQDLTWRGYPNSTDGMKEQELKNAHYMSAFDDEEDLLNIYATYPTLEVFEIPEGLGDQFSYMGWQKVTKETSPQYTLRENYGMNFDDEGFAKIKDRYVIATTTKYGDVGQCLDVVLEDGKVLQCVIGDIKDPKDKGWAEWGHSDGHNVVEFVVDCETWYQPGWHEGAHANPGTEDFHPEWGTVKKVIKVDNNYLG